MSAMPCTASYERYVDSNGWSVLEYLHGQDSDDVSLSFKGSIRVELVYGPDRSRPAWQDVKFRHKNIPSDHPVIEHCRRLLMVNPDVDTVIKALSLYVPNLEPLDE